VVRYINPEVDGVHPLRLTLSDDEMADIMEGISKGADWMTLEEIEAAQDYLFDFIVAEKQNVEGVTTVQ
jgi:hypothetical protein